MVYGHRQFLFFRHLLDLALVAKLLGLNEVGVDLPNFMLPTLRILKNLSGVIKQQRLELYARTP